MATRAEQEMWDKMEQELARRNDLIGQLAEEIGRLQYEVDRLKTVNNNLRYEIENGPMAKALGRVTEIIDERDADMGYGRALQGIEDAQHGYPPDDPKHPEYHSTHADLWDAREGK